MAFKKPSMPSIQEVEYCGIVLLQLAPGSFREGLSFAVWQTLFSFKRVRSSSSRTSLRQTKLCNLSSGSATVRRLRLGIERVAEDGRCLDTSTTAGELVPEDFLTALPENGKSIEFEFDWQTEDDHYLIDNYDIMSNGQLQLRYNTSEKDLEARIKHLG